MQTPNDASVSGIVSCPAQAHCAITWVRLYSQDAADPVPSSVEVGAAHLPLPPEGRFILFPGEQVRIRWELANHADVASGTLLCFRKGSNVPIWTQDVGPFTGDQGEFLWNGRTTPGAPLFPDDLLTEESSPYKLLMVIRPKPGVICDESESRTYFEVKFLHKYKFHNYVPSTNIGRFGLEFDPMGHEVKLVVRYLLAPTVPASGQFDHPLGYYETFLAQHIGQMWDQRYSVKLGDRAWYVTLHFECAGSYTIDHKIEKVEDGGPALLGAMERNNASICFLLRAGSGLSYLSAGVSRYTSVVLTDDAFKTQHSPTLGGRAIDGQQRGLDADMTAAIGAGGHAVTKTVTPDAGPSCTVAFTPNSDALSLATRGVLTTIARDMANRAQGLAQLRVWIKGTRTAAEGPGAAGTPLESRRAAAVAQFFTDAGLTPITEPTETSAAAAQVVVVACYRNQGEWQTFIGQKVNYCAAVHEFGHALGLPDEYFTYNPESHPVAAPSQPKLRALAAAAHVTPGPAQNQERENTDLMSCGEVFRERYYLTVLQALRKVVGLDDHVPAVAAHGPSFAIVPNAGPAPAPAALDPDFAPSVRAVREGERQIAEGLTAVATIRATMRLEATNAGAARVVYADVLDRRTLAPVPGVAHGPDDHLLLAVGIQRGRHILHCGQYVKPRLLEPTIDVPVHFKKEAGGFTLARRDGAYRQLVVLRATGAFTGHGTFTCATPGVQFYDAPTNGHLVDAADPGHQFAAARLATGVELYAEGPLDGAAMRLVLAAAAGQVSPHAARVTLHVPTGTPSMEVYPFSVDQEEALEPLSQAARSDPGVIVPIAADGSEHLKNARVRVVVWIPAGYTEPLIFRVSAEHLSSPSVHIYKDGSPKVKGVGKKRSPAGNAEKWHEYKLDPSGGRGRHFTDGTAQCMTLWLEGVRASTDPRNVEVQLVSATFTNDAPTTTHSRFTLTVVSAPELAVEIPTTPPLTQRPSTSDNQPPPAQRFCATTIATAPGVIAAPHRDRDFARNPPVVLIKGATPEGHPVKLKARVTPASSAVTFYMRRANDDEDSIRQNNPHDDAAPLMRLARVVKDNEAQIETELPTRAAGSFHVLLKVGNSTLYVLNVVIAEVQALPGPEVPLVANLPAQKDEITAGFVEGKALVVRTGPVPWPAPVAGPPMNNKPHACAVLAGRVRVTGGGPDGRRGVDRVFVGWIQNKVHSHLAGTYRQGPPPNPEYRSTGIFVRNQAQAKRLNIAGGSDAHFPLPAAGGEPSVPQLIEAPDSPLLDTGNEIIGGCTARLGRSLIDRQPVMPGVLGQEIVAQSMDSPGTEFLITSLSHPDALLIRADYEHTFRAFLCAWTDASGKNGGGPTPGPGDLLYAAVGQVEWGFAASWMVTWPDALAAKDKASRNAVPDWQAQGRIEAAPGRALNVSITAPFIRYVARPAEGLVEVRPPTPIRTFAWNAQ